MVRLLLLNGISRGSAETDCRELIKIVSALSGAARQSWQRAGRRLFDVGIQAGNEAHPFEGVQLSAATLRAAGALGATIQFTVYRQGFYDAAEPTEQQHRGRTTR